MKLSKTQQELLDAMKGGVIVHYMQFAGSFNPRAYYYRSDNLKKCTAAAEALREKGLVDVFRDKHRGHSLRAKKD